MTHTEKASPKKSSFQIWSFSRKDKAMFDTIIALVKMIAILAVVIYLINLSLKYLSRYTNQQSTQLEIIQRLTVTKSSAIAIVKILDRYYVMSLAEQENQILRELTTEEVIRLTQENQTMNHEQLGNQFAERLKENVQQLMQKRKGENDDEK